MISGALLFIKKFPEASGKILQRCKGKKEHLHDVEQKVFAATHAKVGGELLKGWGLPALLYEPVYFHHQPEKAEKHALITKILHVADSMVDEIKLGCSGEAVANPVNPEILEELGFSELPVEKFSEEILELYEETLAAFL